MGEGGRHAERAYIGRKNTGRFHMYGKRQGYMCTYVCRETGIRAHNVHMYAYTHVTRTQPTKL